MVIVPDSLDAAIHAKLDAAFLVTPDAEQDREALYGMVLAYFDEHGVIPEFTLAKKEGGEG